MSPVSWRVSSARVGLKDHTGDCTDSLRTAETAPETRRTAMSDRNSHWQTCEMPDCSNDVPTATGICDECAGVGRYDTEGER